MAKTKKKVLITGGAGFLGSHTTRKFLDAGCDVYVLDFFHQYIFPLSQTYLSNMEYRIETLMKGAFVIRGNINNKVDLRRNMAKVQPNYIIHLGALPLANVALWKTEEAFDSIMTATFNILDVMADTPKLDKFVYISSSMVYGDFKQIPMPEDGIKNPKEVYGGMKYAGEILTRTLTKRFDTPHIIIRPSALYGPTDNNRRVIQKFVENAVLGRPLEVTNPEATHLDFTFVEDAAEGIVKATLNEKVVNEAFNMTRGEGRSLADAVKILKGMFKDITVKEKHESDAFRPNRGALDVTKAKKLLGYEPAHSLEQGLKKYVDFVKSVVGKN